MEKVREYAEDSEQESRRPGRPLTSYYADKDDPDTSSRVQPLAMLSDDRRHKEGQNGLSRNKNLKIMREDSRSRSLDNLSGSSSNDLNVKVFFFFSLSLNGCKDIAQRSTSVQRRLKS